MVLILYGNMVIRRFWLDHGTYILDDNPICDCFRSSQMPYTDQITENAPCVRTYSLVTI